MISIKGNRKTVYFDINTIKKGVASILNRKTNKMFLDMEFTMPSYDFSGEKPFVSEIIQYGILIENEEGQVVLSESSLVKPKDPSGLNARTFNFLNLQKEDFAHAITYKAFYKRLGYRIIKVGDGFIFYQKRKSDPDILTPSMDSTSGIGSNGT